MFHCHIEFHLEMGMSLFIKVGKDENLPRKPRNWPQCYPLSITSIANQIDKMAQLLLFAFIQTISLINL